MSEISGIRQHIQPDIRYPVPTGYLAGNPVSGFQNGQISGRPDIRPAKLLSLVIFFGLLKRFKVFSTESRYS